MLLRSNDHFEDYHRTVCTAELRRLCAKTHSMAFEDFGDDQLRQNENNCVSNVGGNRLIFSSYDSKPSLLYDLKSRKTVDTFVHTKSSKPL